VPAAPDTSDLRALARVILDQEDLEQSAMRAHCRPYELAPVRRRILEGARVGLLVGVGLGLASLGSGTARTFRSPTWVVYFLLFVVIVTAAGVVCGAIAGVVVQYAQRRRLDSELAEVTVDLPADHDEEHGGPRSR
jgi:hypothetical protein